MLEKGKKIQWKIIFPGLDDMKSVREKNTRENTKENVVIFSLLLPMKIIEENKKEKKCFAIYIYIYIYI